MELRKIVQIDLFAGQEQRCRCRMDVRTRWAKEEGMGGMNWANRVDINDTTTCKVDS